MPKFYRKNAERGIDDLDTHLAGDTYLGASEPTIADLSCGGDIAFADLCAFDIPRWPNVARWYARLKALPGFKMPFDLLPMQDEEVAVH
jgi:glutathione S-transferase